MKTVAVTGYKPHELGIFKPDAKEITFIKKALERRLLSLLDNGLEWVIISGQPGVELWAGELVIQLKEEWEDLKLAVLPPFLEQEKIWPEPAQLAYAELIKQADFVKPISNTTYTNPSQLRNKNDFIINHTEGMLILYDEDMTGTPKFYLGPAETRQEHEGYEIIRVTPQDIQDVVEEEQWL